MAAWRIPDVRIRKKIPTPYLIYLVFNSLAEQNLAATQNIHRSGQLLTPFGRTRIYIDILLIKLGQ